MEYYGRGKKDMQKTARGEARKGVAAARSIRLSSMFLVMVYLFIYSFLAVLMDVRKG